MHPNRRLASQRAAPLLALVLLGGCSKSLTLMPTPNQPPTVRLTSGPVDTNEVCRPRPGISCYSLLLHWVGFDPDGRVASYFYAVDPPDQGDTTWIATPEKEKRFVFEVNSGSSGRDSLTLMQGYHVVAVRAVDNRGASSPTAFRAFFSWTTAPTIQIVNPRPRSAGLFLPPSVRFRWQGYDDDDSNIGKRPVRYKYLLIGPGNDDSVVPGGIPAIIGSHGSLIRRYYAPQFRAEDGWVAVSGDTLTAQFTDLVPGSSYMFIVAAFDESGAYSPVFQLTTNVLYFTVGYATAVGPTMAIFNDTFYYKYPGPGFNPANEVRVDVPGGRLISISWWATPPPGADIIAYRWMVDGDVFDPHSRTDEISDLRHWSTPSANVTTATIGPFGAGDHFFYAQAEDNTGLKALATVHFTCVVPSFARPVLIVDDTRRSPDSFLADGTLQTSTGVWPAAAELDTFLYAVGGVPWRRAPAGMLSPQGVLAGFDFDTLGTRVAAADGALPLATLAKYRHVIWLEDFEGARSNNSFNGSVDPMTLLNYMTIPGKVNTLMAYLGLGGDVWMVGGGGALATLYKFNELGNDMGNGNIVFSSSTSELVPGRFMYNVGHWQSEIRDRSNQSLSGAGNVVSSVGRFSSHPGIYANLPVSFDARTTASDPLPPLRTAPFFYPTTFSCEYVNASNVVVEPVEGDPIDFAIDSFDDADPSAVPGRWRSSDTLNTQVGTVVVPAVSGGAAGRALRVGTQGGGASDGDQIRHQFGGTRDYSGLNAIHMSVREDPAGHVAGWRIRLFDADGNTVSAPVPATGQPGAFAALDIADATFALDPASRPGFDVLHVTGIGLELERGDAAATTDFDDLRAVTQPAASVLDTLLAVRIGFGANPLRPTMTVYHGHGLSRPFVFTGFAPWSFRRVQCRQLFDFVLRGLWGVPRGASTASVAIPRSAAAAGRVLHSTPAAHPAPSARAARHR